MNKSMLVVAALLSLGFQSVCNAQWGNHSHNPWRLEFGTAILDRQGDTGNITPVLTDSVTGATYINGEQLSDPGTGAGVDLSLQYFPGANCFSYEGRARYFGWEDVTADTGSFSLATVPTLVFDSMDTRYESDYFSFEMNAKRNVRPGFDLVGGARFIAVEERVLLSGEGVIPLPAPFLDTAFKNDVDVKTSNPMLGLQIGADYGVGIGRMSLNSFVRAGGYINFSRQNTRLVNSALATDTSSSGSKEEMAFAGEVGVRLNYEIFENHLFGYVGGEAHFLDGIASAPGQLQNPGFAGVSNSDSPRFQGITFGLDARF